MKKAIPVVVISVVVIIVSNIYYYLDTYSDQLQTQKEILSRELSHGRDEISGYFKEVQTNILLLLSEEQLNQLFDGTGRSVEAEKRLELLFSRYSKHLNELRVFHPDGRTFTIRKGVGQAFITAFGHEKYKEAFASSVLVDAKGNSLSYLQPLIGESKVFGYIEFNIDVQSFFCSVLKNFALESYQFQWIVRPNETLLFNTLGQTNFFPEDVGYIVQKSGGQNMLSLEHKILIGEQKAKVLSVFSEISTNGSLLYLVFSLPINLITANIVTNSVIVGVISVFVILLILTLFGKYIKRKLEEEKRLAASEEALRKILHFLPVGILLIDGGESIRLVNKAALDMFSIEDEDHLMDRKLTEQVLFQNLDNVEKSRYTESSNKYVFKDGLGEEVVVLSEKIPFFLQRQRFIINVFYEVTPLGKEVRDEARANESKTYFLANISHELRTPLNGILGMTDLLSRHKDITGEAKEMLSVVKRSGDTLLALINDILDFSKIDAGKMEIESIPFDLAGEVVGTIKMFLAGARERGLALTWNTTVELPNNFLGDPMRLRQVLNNLLSNAIKFTHTGRVHLSISKAVAINGSAAINFTVKDTGIGIGRHQLKTIFDAFSQADDSTTRQYGGTGLGTSISKQLVQMMGGEIWADSPSSISDNLDNPGSEFSFTVPMKVSKPTKNLDFVSITKFAEISALIVTDDELQVSIMVKNLRALKVYVKVVPPSREVLEGLRNQQDIHLLVVDNRPDYSGLDFLQELYNYQLQDNYLILLQSNDFKRMNMNIGKRLGADVYFRKPVKFNILKEFLLKNFSSIKKEEGSLLTDYPDDLRVLVAEDNLLNQKVAQGVFRRIGYDIDLASTGSEAIEKNLLKSYDIIFMDIVMPEMDGLLATKKLKELGVGCPVIAMTASNDPAEKRKAYDAGMDDFISKPAKPEDLFRLISKWCSSQ